MFGLVNTQMVFIGKPLCKHTDHSKQHHRMYRMHITGRTLSTDAVNMMHNIAAS